MPLGHTFDDAIAAVGNTPMIRINRLIPAEHATVFVKCEFFQPLNSVKDRLGKRIVTIAASLGERHLSTPLFERA